MDFVGLLPKSGHEYVLVIVDYATRYPEAIQLHKSNSKNIAWELVLLLGWVGIPGDILTDPGASFVSQLMQDLCQLLEVLHLHISVYLPQTNSLVEHFNQTLKWMLRRVIDSEGHNWDLLPPTFSLQSVKPLRPQQGSPDLSYSSYDK